jgi:integrase
MKAIHQRANSNEGPGPMHPLLTEDIKEMIDSLSLEGPSDEDGVWEKAMHLRAQRDQALILLGYAAALRASELAKVQVTDFGFNQQGMEVHIEETKTSPRTVGVGFSKDVRYCAVRSLKKWTNSAEITSGPVFRRVFNSARIADREIDRRTVWRVIKGAAKDANVDKADEVGAHSVRRGHATQAVLNGVSLERLQKQLGHKDPATTSKYVRDARRMQEETSQDLGL